MNSQSNIADSGQSHWSRAICDARNQQLPGFSRLRQLVDGELSLLVIRNLFSPAELELYRQRIKPRFASATTTRYTNGALTTIGPYLARFLPEIDGYLAEAQRINRLFEEIGFDLCGRMRAQLQHLLEVSSVQLAAEPGRGPYAEGVVRIHADGVRNPLHNDNIMRDGAAHGIALARVRHQLSCVVCLQECDSGGELHHYARRWNVQDEAYKIQGGLGYEEKVVAGHAVDIYKPQTGDVYLINPTYYHSIETVRGADRITLGFFIGFPDDSLRHAFTWS